jgi:hypothetical protein
MAGGHVKQYLVRVNVDLGPLGYPTYSYNTSPGDATSLTVNPGDLIAWFVQVLPTARPQSYPPYRIDFQDPSFFRTPSLEVSEGGYSPYLQVRTIKGFTKYTVTVQGVSPPGDPEMQTGNFPLDTSLRAVLTPARQIAITWDGVAGSTPTLTIDTVAKPLPSTLSVHPANKTHSADIVTFLAAQAFDIVLGKSSPDSNVPSPFDGPTVIDGQTSTTAALMVATDALGYTYPMNFVLLSDGITKSADFKLNVTAWPAPGPRKGAAKPK